MDERQKKRETKECEEAYKWSKKDYKQNIS